MKIKIVPRQGRKVLYWGGSNGEGGSCTLKKIKVLFCISATGPNGAPLHFSQTSEDSLAPFCLDQRIKKEKFLITADGSRFNPNFFFFFFFSYRLYFWKFTVWFCNLVYRPVLIPTHEVVCDGIYTAFTWCGCTDFPNIFYFPGAHSITNYHSNQNLEKCFTQSLI